VALPYPVATLMSFTNPGSSQTKLFACTADPNSVVYDISTPNTALPALPYPVPPSTSPFPPASPISRMQAGTGAQVPGEWSWVNYTTSGGSYLAAVLFGKGYYLYNDQTGWMQVPTNMGPGAPGAREVQFEYPTGTFHQASTMLFTFSWKGRLWFLQGGTGLAFFLPLNALYGKASSAGGASDGGVLDLGQFLVHGGGLAYAINWTYDSGAGLDDGLVFVGNGGDMAIYQGTDPKTAATFSLKGTWFVGRIPPGRRSFCDYGGDILIVTEYGVNSVSDFVSGRLVNLQGQSSVAEKFNPTIARRVSEFINERYWQLVPYPTEEVVVLVAPVRASDTQERVSIVMSHFGKAWTSITGMEPYTAVVHQGQFIFSTREGKVYQGFYGYEDGSSYDGTIAGNEVVGQFQTGFYDYGSPNANKRVQRVRLLGRADGLPAYVLAMEPEYAIGELPNVGAPALNANALWDVAIWDSATWQARSGYWAKWFGVACFGKRLSLLAAVRGTGYTLVTDYEVTYEEGIGL
jgi:hypothetical protein